MKNTKISWTDHTLNLWWGCSKVNEACKNCYAEGISKRFGNDLWGEDKDRKIVFSASDDLDKYQRKAKKENKKVKVFVGSMMDIFEDSKNLIGFNLRLNTNCVRDLFFSSINKNLYPNLIFLFLTKRPFNISKYIPDEWKDNPPNNVWIGVTVYNEDNAWEMGKLLMDSKWNGKMFFSIEPQLEEIRHIDLTGIDWVIQGGESGHNKRQFKLEWADTMRKICKEQNVPYFFKQIDGKAPIPKEMNIKQYPKF